MPIFDNPHEELNRLQEQLLEDEDLSCEESEEEEEYEEEYDGEYDEDFEEESEDAPEPPPPPVRSNRGLILLALAELALIGFVAAYWLRVIG